MGQITIKGDNSPTGILRHWERKTRHECAREILRCWQKIETLEAENRDLKANNDHQRERRNAARNCIIRMLEAEPAAKILDVANCRTDFWATAVGGYQPKRGDCLYLMEAPGDE